MNKKVITYKWLDLEFEFPYHPDVFNAIWKMACRGMQISSLTIKGVR